jgi:UDP-N-acetylmuramoyl-L-alanyl-D-glutamate--2,6-diaminopimelate ligase
MNLLLDEIDVLETAGDPSAAEVRGIEHDSRRVTAGDLFVCVPGHRTDGHEHAAAAVARGAVGLVCERLVNDPVDRSLPQVRVAEGTIRPAMAALAAAFFGHPSRQLVMAGVTGTNGKTTVTALLASVLAAAGHPASAIGTLSGARTTPESPELQGQLARIRDSARPGGPAPAVALEVSSHALVQARVDQVHFDVAVFTNLSHDHLDFHGTMEAYFAAKASLFTPERAVGGVVNGDDQWGRRLLSEARIPMVAVRRESVADVMVAPGRTAFTWRGQRVVMPLTGAINVDNALLAAEAAVFLGVGPETVAAGLAATRPVPGRMEVVAAPGRGGPPFTVLVDYAHTPTGLEVALGESRRLAGPGGRVLVAFGCGGNRDRAKRPLMGAAATTLADVAFVTSDNPRHEDPDAIIDEILSGAVPSPSGAVASGRLVVEPDRHRAISTIVAAARAGDVVLIAGKGHERHQEIAGERMDFDDRSEATGVLAAAWPGDPADWVPAVDGPD